MHTKKKEKKTPTRTNAKKKENDYKNHERSTMCQKHTSYTLPTLLF
jgi:hypothetical protein